MSHAAAGASESTSPADVSGRQDAENGERPAAHVSDLAIASAAAHAVRAVPGVVDLSPGLITPAATYGSGQRVTGVVVHHLAPESVVLEIHVVLSESQFNTASAAAVQKTDERATNGVGVLVEAARQIRGAVSKAVRKATSLVPVRVDVLIDDLR